MFEKVIAWVQSVSIESTVSIVNKVEYKLKYAKEQKK